MLSADELQLLAAADGDYLGSLCRALEPRLRAMTTAFGIAPEDADDVLQDTWIRVLARRTAFENRGSLDGWVMQICRNQCLAFQRSRRHHVDMEIILEAMPSPPVDVLSAVRRGRLTEHVCDSVDDLIMTLPRRQLQVAALRWLLGWSTQQIASALGIAPGTVKAELHRARGRLRRRLASKKGQGMVEHDELQT